jgi:hypothetical protein
VDIDLGGVRATLVGGREYQAALAAWITPGDRHSAERHPIRIDIALSLRPARRPPGEPDVRFGSLGLWYAGDVVRGYGDDGHGGTLDLRRLRGEVNAPRAGDRARLALHQALRPLLSLALGRAGRFLVHAGCVVTDGRALLIIGRSGAGKSTLSVQLALAGGALVADDTVYVDEGAEHAYGFGERARLDAAQVDRLGAASMPGVDHKRFVEVPRRLAACTPTHLIVLDAESGSVRSLEPSEAMRQLLPAMAFGSDAVVDPARMRAAAALAQRTPAIAVPARPSSGDVAVLLEAVRDGAELERTA